MSDASPSAPERPLWFERVFTLDLPAWMLANVMERLRGTPARLEERLRDVSPAVLTRRDGERWSIQENAGHLLDLEELWLGRVADFADGRERLRAADLTNRRTHEAAHNARSLDALLAEFRAARARFVARLEALSAAEQERTALHPRLGVPMRAVDHAFFVAEHDDHHLARITELLCAEGAGSTSAD
jgi:uncharacterized damage-inducible protein DinB